MRISKMLCIVAAGSLFVQSVDAQTRGGNTTKGQTATQGQQGGGRGGPGGGGPGGPGGFAMGGMRGMMGGGGGMMGRLAASPVFLLRSEAVQKEIKLTSEQKEKMKKAEESQNDKRQKMFEDMRNQGQRGQNNQQGGRGGFDFTAMRDAMQKMATDAESDLAKILTADQRQRLAEIALQVEGPTAILNRADIGKKLNLQNQQITKMTQVKQLADQKQQELRTQMMASMGFGRGGPGGGPGGPGGPAGGNAGGFGRGRGGNQPGGNQPNQPNQQANQGRPNQGQQPAPGAAMTDAERQKRRDEMTKNMEKVREQTEKLNEQLDAAILKLLTKRQSDAFKKMNGEKFDVDSIMETMPQMGRGGPGGGRPATSVD